MNILSGLMGRMLWMLELIKSFYTVPCLRIAFTFQSFIAWVSCAPMGYFMQGAIFSKKKKKKRWGAGNSHHQPV